MSLLRSFVSKAVSRSAVAALGASLHGSSAVTMASRKAVIPMEDALTDTEADPVESRKLHNSVSVLSGAPEEHLSRHLLIYRPTKVATQQGRGTKLQQWHLRFVKHDGKSDRWTNPLMGWTSTADPLTNLDVTFPTKEAAVDYAKRNGFEFSVEEPMQEKENVRNFQAFGHSMVHQWRHNKIPVYEDDK